MLWAAPLAGLASALALPLVGLAEDAPPTDPRMMGLLFGTTLLTSWATMIVGKIGEGEKRRTGRRQLVMLALGALVGLAGFGIWDAIHLGPIRDGSVLHDLVGYNPASMPWKANAALQFAAFFAVAFAFFPWWGAIGRDRKRRLRLWPIGLAGVVGGTLGLMFPSLLPIGALTPPLAMIVAQLVSPWSKEAAEYAREARYRASRRAA